MKSLADEINKRPLPKIPLSNISEPCFLIPTGDNSQLRHNYQIYSEELLRKRKEKELNRKNNLSKEDSKEKLASFTRKRVSLSKIKQEKPSDVTIPTVDKQHLVKSGMPSKKTSDNYDDNADEEDEKSEDNQDHDFPMHELTLPEDNYDF